MNITVNKTIHMDLEEVAKAMGITKHRLSLIRCKTSRHYHSFFPEPLPTNTRKVYVLRSEFAAYFEQITSVSSTGIDPLAPRDHAKRTTKASAEADATLAIFEARLNRNITIMKNVRSALFGDTVLRCDFLEHAIVAKFGCDRNGVETELVSKRQEIYSIWKKDRQSWAVMTPHERWKILLTISEIFSLEYDEGLAELGIEIRNVLRLMQSKKNWFSKWWELHKPENNQYKLFLKNI